MKKRPDLVVMLTNNDLTVPDALEVFESCRDLPVQDWGFKNVGPEEKYLKELGRAMKDAGKNVYFEVISYNEEAYMRAAKLAEECKVDFLTGTKYSPTLHEVLKKAGINYSPFVGKVGCVWKGRSGMLMGDYDELVAEAKDLLYVKKTYGLDVSAYRHIESPEKVIDSLTQALPEAHICIAGSVDTYEKTDKLFDAGVAKFTMGSALFKGHWVPGGSFRENLEHVLNYMESR